MHNISPINKYIYVTYVFFIFKRLIYAKLKNLKRTSKYSVQIMFPVCQ